METPPEPQIQTLISTQIFDVVVMGCGPAGLGIAAQCARKGLTTMCISPSLDTPWQHNYACWIDDVADLSFAVPFTKTWPKVAVFLDKTRQHLIERPYGLINNTGLKNKLCNDFVQNGGKFLKAVATSVTSQNTCLSTQTSGLEIKSRLVIDATGQSSRLSPRIGRGERSAQRAVGAWSSQISHPFDPEIFVLMDFRNDRTEINPSTDTSPTFLYAMPMSVDQVYLEETSLQQKPGMSFDTLVSRLAHRFACVRVPMPDISEFRKTHIFMDIPPSKHRNGVVAFGAAAGLVHPATGYSVSISLFRSRKIAEAIASGLLNKKMAPERLAKSVQKTLWSRRDKVQFLFFQIGAEFIRTLTLHETRSFFYAFFCIPVSSQRVFFRGKMSILVFMRIGATMLRHLPFTLSLKLSKFCVKRLIDSIIQRLGKDRL